ncbi:acyl carrier protein [Nocardia nepalensis]|uniref:acyl carrier protein n=1 Tax=Nocardia nepalensis TaxID=3375448 RepID=UPI003B676A93
MTSEQSVAATAATRETIQHKLLSFLEARLKTSVTADQDLFARGLVTSMFAMELVVQLEQFFGIAIVGADLQLANFRSVNTMTELVLRRQ